MAQVHRDHDPKDFRINSVADLFSYEDAPFIERAYVVTLGRFPDADGKRYYLSQLRAGYSKIHVLNQLYRSSENKITVVSVAGLDSMLRRHRCASWYGLRWLSKILGYTGGNSSAERQSRALLRELAGIREAIVQLQLASPLPKIPSVERQAKQSLTSGGQKLVLPLSTDNRTRRLVEALEREILFIKRVE